ncbi:DUF2635 domain-containing protein [Crenobacter caeni]|uniref:DUF2635 domain-containing protein n=1 Tax=Crenobacter caeni TaxID=2705474 RepID=A0A6B2KNE9_9NEIS|nr:DUF2635 domain-containing protein [Crenobacter caeni]NDV11673.1 DUF2635 domain-containing protein [Crenobacter caeni]
MYVKPAQDRAVTDPGRGDILPAEGREVPETQYWLRRLADGDVERARPVKAKGVAE